MSLKKANEENAKRDQERQRERERWQQEYVARQSFVQQQLQARKKEQRLPKFALGLIFLLAGGTLFFAFLFVLSFVPAAKTFVQTFLSFLQIF